MNRIKRLGLGILILCLCVTGMNLIGTNKDIRADVPATAGGLGTLDLPENAGNAANEWQVMSGGFYGLAEHGKDVTEFDKNANVSYASDMGLRLTKNVIGTDVGNEFIMYESIEPQMEWKSILALNTIKITNSNKPIQPPAWPSSGRISDTFLPEPSGEYQTPVQFQYYAIVNGRRVDLANVIMYTNVPKVPNGGIGIGNPFLGPKSGTFYARNRFHLKSNGNGVSTAEVDISALYSKFEFAYASLSKPQTAVEQPGNYIVPSAETIRVNGGNAALDQGRIIWELPQQELGVLPYEMDGDGNIYPSGIQKKLSNGKLTYYWPRAYEMTYRFRLDVGADGFVSAGSTNSSNRTDTKYAVRTSLSPSAQNDPNSGGEVTYINPDGESGTADFKTPYIKGLLYDLEFQKVTEGGGASLSGVTFALQRVASGETLGGDEISITGQTDAEGWIKFHNLPWGKYQLTETALNQNDPFQRDYIKEVLPKKWKTVRLGEVINPSGLTEEHGSGHSVDLASDVNNRLYLFQNGIVENQVNHAKLRIVKQVNQYDALAAEMKQIAYPIRVSSETAYTVQENGPTPIQKEDSIKHGEVLEYDLIVPNGGAEVTLEELIPDAVRNRIQFTGMSIKKNQGSTESAAIVQQENGGLLKLLPGNDITVTIENSPVGTVRIKSITDNYAEFGDRLKDDEFIYNIGTGKGNIGSVLKHGETSGVINIKEKTTLNIDEIIPKEYSQVEIRIVKDNKSSKVNGNEFTVSPGEHVVIEIHNRYAWKPYFHAFDSKNNRFSSDS